MPGVTEMVILTKGRASMAHQPVFDTLQVADEMEQKGMEREQATGLAQVLGNQLGEHVAVRKDLDLGFEGVRAEIAGVRAEVRLVHTKVDGVNSKLNLGFALMAAFITAVAGMQLFALTRPPVIVQPVMAAPPQVVVAPAAIQPAASPAESAPDDTTTSTERASVSPAPH